MYPSQISQITNEFFEFESPGFDDETDAADAARGRGVIEILG